MHISMHTYAHLSRHIYQLYLYVWIFIYQQQHRQLNYLMKDLRFLPRLSQAIIMYTLGSYQSYILIKRMQRTFLRFETDEKYTSLKTLIYLAYLVLKMMFLNLGKNYTDEMTNIVRYESRSTFDYFRADVKAIFLVKAY